MIGRLLKRYTSKSTKRTSDGLASIVIVVVLVALLTTVALGFAIIMNREQQKALNNQQGQAAYDAAASGINDVVSYLKTQAQAGNSNVSVTTCGDLFTAHGASPAAIPNSNLSSNTKYTCGLVDSTPPELDYQSIPTGESQVSYAGTTATITKLMISWQATDRKRNGFVPSSSAGSLFDEYTWNTKGSASNCHNTPGTGASAACAPLLRVSLYPVPTATKSINFGATNPVKTFFLYPTQAPSANSSVTNLSYNSNSGTLAHVRCGNNTVSAFSGSADYDCNLIINSLPSDKTYAYYLRLTPIYTAADVKVKANQQGNQVINFSNSQAAVDVTAQSGPAVKRLEAHVDISGANTTTQDLTPDMQALPEYGLQSAGAICKRLEVPLPGQPVYTDPDTSGCELSYPQNVGQKPKVTTAGAQHYGNAGTSDSSNYYLNGIVNPNGADITSCYIYWDNDNAGYVSGQEWTAASSKANCAGSLPVGTNDVNVQTLVDIGNSNESNKKTMYFQYCAVNSIGKSCGSIFSFTAGAPAVAITSASNNSSSQTLTLKGTVNGHHLSSVTAWFHYVECGSGAPKAKYFYSSPAGQPQSVPVNNTANALKLVVNPWTFYYCGYNNPSNFQMCASNDGVNSTCSNNKCLGSCSGTSTTATSTTSGGGGGGTGTITCHFYRAVLHWTANTFDVNGDCSGADQAHTTYSAHYSYCGSTSSEEGPHSSSTFSTNFGNHTQGAATLTGTVYGDQDGAHGQTNGSTTYSAAGGSECGEPGTSTTAATQPSATTTTSTTTSTTAGGGGGGGCFIAGTLILTPAGETPIEQLKAGDWVESWDTATQRMVATQIAHTIVHTSRPTFWVMTDNGSVTTTSEHPFWTSRGWVTAGELKEGSQVMDENGHYHRVLFTMASQNRRVYNFEVASGYHDYFANHTLVHNFNSL